MLTDNPLAVPSLCHSLIIDLFFLSPTQSVSFFICDLALYEVHFGSWGQQVMVLKKDDL